MLKKLLVSIVAMLALALIPISAQGAATLLPPGEQCFSGTTGINGMVGTLGTLTAGSGGTAGTYLNVPLTGGSGSGATGNITVSSGVTQVVVFNPGTQYVVGDVLSASSGNIGGITGFSVPINSVSINSSLAGGQVYFYIPNTSSFKTTWFNADQSASHQNTNPVKLDQNGCAIVYGTGSYRQVVQDSLGNTVWDQITTDTSANNNTFWAGSAHGTPNALTVVDPGFNATDGSIIQFVAIATNTSAATLNPSSFGAIPIVKSTTNGPVSLTGGEIQQGNVVSVLYSAVSNSFTILNPVIQSQSGSTAPLCGTTGLSIVSDNSTPNTVLDVAIGDGVAISPTGAVINRASASFNINFGTNGAGGLDTGAMAASTVYYLWLIDNGAAPAGLASLSSTAPTMPAGYTYKCRIGAAPTTTAPVLYTIRIKGQIAILTGDLSATTFKIAGVVGTCFSSIVTETFNAPLTAITLSGGLSVVGTHVAGVSGGAGQGGASVNIATATGFQIPFNLAPTTTGNTLSYCSDSNLNSMTVSGWTDSVNAH